ncbi:50S ribosomal protein L7/L12 [Rosa chinensis]|nr:50S ribosomal protein L7/L12 [Rosa chinensis]
MRYLRFISPHLSRIHKTLPQNPNLHSRPYLSSHFAASYTTAAPEKRPAPPEKVSAIADEISGLTLLEVSDLTEVLREKLGIKEMPAMMMMMPGMGIGGLRGGGKGGGAAAGKAEEKKEKTAFDVKLDSFDAAAKIKVIKEVRTFTALGLKEAKDLVEKAPTLLKKGVTKEEAESIVAKMKEVGAVVSME